MLETASPSTDIDLINHRLDLVEMLRDDEALRSELTNILKRTHDTQRILQKLSLGRGSVDDLISIARTIAATNEVMDLLLAANKPAFEDHVARLSAPNGLADLILSSIDEEGVRQQQQEVLEVAAATAAVEGIETSGKEMELEEVMNETTSAAAVNFPPRERGMVGRKKRIERGIQKSISRNIMMEQDGDDAWVMKKT